MHILNLLIFNRLHNTFNFNWQTVGVYASLDFRDGDLILKDQMLVGAQHSSNKVSAMINRAKIYFSFNHLFLFRNVSNSYFNHSSCFFSPECVVFPLNFAA